MMQQKKLETSSQQKLIKLFDGNSKDLHNSERDLDGSNLIEVYKVLEIESNSKNTNCLKYYNASDWRIYSNMM